MRTQLLSITLVLTSIAAASAQNASPNLAAILRDWEQAVMRAKDLSCEIKRTAIDTALKTTDKHEGAMYVLKDGKANRVRYELFRSGTKQLAEKWIVTDKELWEYSPSTKIVRVRALPKDQDGAVKQPAVLSLITGAGAAQRFDISLLPADAHYYYLLVKPRLPDDKAEFRQVQVALLRTDSLPRQITLIASNSTVVTWDLTKVRVNSSFDRKQLDPDFTGWKVENVKPLPQGK